MKEIKPEGKIFLTTIHHSDLTWQHSYQEYDGIREEQLNIVMGFFEKYPEYGFIIDQAYVLQNYLQRNPERLEQIRKLVDGGNGTFELIGGYSIPDMNMISGEAFLRNCMLGQGYYQETFGCTPECASLMDSFGTPLQTPQMLALLGYRYLAPGRMPNAPEELDIDAPFLWEGPAGTSIIVVPQNAGIDKTSYITNVPVILNEDERFEKTFRDLQKMKGNVLAYYISEVQLLDEAFFKHHEKVNGDPDAERRVTFGRLADYCKTLDGKQLPVYAGEFNPVFTGCYTTRIGVKQQIRAAENALFYAELANALKNQEADLTDAWKQLSLGEFHDAACGCHHDAGNADVMEKLQFALQCAQKSAAGAMGSGSAVAVLNPSACEEEQLIETTLEALPAGVPVQQDGERYYFTSRLPAFGVQAFETGSADGAARAQKKGTTNYRGETDFFTFDFTSPMPKISSKRYCHNVFGQENFGEILFRHESGSMWSEVLREVPYGTQYQDEEVCGVEEGPLFIKVTARGAVRPGHRPISGNSGDYWPGFGELSFQKEYIFPRHIPDFRLRITVNFKGCNTKVSLRVPVELDPLKAKALYDTPFAAAERRPYFEVPYRYRDTVQTLRPGEYTYAKGDFPALHWVDYTDEAIGLSIANNGTPGHQLVGKDIFISLLRSGTNCQDGTMYPQPGSYDNGEHVFEFAFTDHAPEEDAAAVALGAVLNRRPVCMPKAAAGNHPGLLKFSRPNIEVSAVYQQNDALVVRAYEILGKETQCSLRCSDMLSCFEADVYGRTGKKLDKRQLRFVPFEIRTFVLKAEGQ